MKQRTIEQFVGRLPARFGSEKWSCEAQLTISRRFRLIRVAFQLVVCRRPKNPLRDRLWALSTECSTQRLLINLLDLGLPFGFKIQLRVSLWSLSTVEPAAVARLLGGVDEAMPMDQTCGKGWRT